MKIRNCFLIFILFFVCADKKSDAQSFSFYINEKGDTIECSMKDKDWIKNPDFIQVTENGIQKKIFPINTRVVKTPGGEIYLGCEMVIDKTPVAYKNKSDIQLEEMLADSEKVFELDTVFLRQIIGGKYSLLELKDERNKIHFLYSVENAKPIELKYSIHLEREHSTRFIMVQEQNEFINQLALLGDVYVFIPADLQNLIYTRHSLAPYFIKLNKGNIDYQLKEEHTFCKVGISITPGMCRLKDFIPHQAPFISDFVFYHGAEFYLRIIPPDDNRKFSVSLGLGYHTNGINTDTLYNLPSNNYYRVSQPFYRMNYVHSDLNFKYALSAKRIRPFAEAGFIYGWMLDYGRVIDAAAGAYGMYAPIKSVSIKHGEQMAYLGGGVQFPNYFLSLDFGRSNGFDERVLFSSRIESVVIKLTYEFHKKKNK